MNVKNNINLQYVYTDFQNSKWEYEIKEVAYIEKAR